MIEHALGDIICEDAPIDDRRDTFPGIYLVRDRDVVFYVGRSTNCYRRLLEHCCLGYGWQAGSLSPLGQLAADNAPDSYEWTVELHGVVRLGYDSADAAEVALIRERRPCLNRRNAVKHDPLPERYRAKERERGGAIQAKMQRFDPLAQFKKEAT
jgi:hypothetical protein